MSTYADYLKHVEAIDRWHRIARRKLKDDFAEAGVITLCKQCGEPIAPGETYYRSGEDQPTHGDCS